MFVGVISERRIRNDLLSVIDHEDAVEAALFSLNLGLTKVKKASRMLAESMAEVSI